MAVFILLQKIPYTFPLPGPIAYIHGSCPYPPEYENDFQFHILFLFPIFVNRIPMKRGDGKPSPLFRKSSAAS
jgi:hypothetical protein